MTELVPNYKIERVVGVKRHPRLHYGRAVSDEQVVYILHSQLCYDSAVDLRLCAYSRALDHGISSDRWSGYEDKPLVLAIEHGRLVPAPVNDNDWTALNG